jgi:beta-glucosidase
MMNPFFMFATGIEGSNPTVGSGKIRVDEFDKCGFYKHWRTDFDLVEDMGIQVLRYGPPLHTTYLGDGRFDWEFADETLADLKRRDIVPIVDLCHFGVPDWIGNFQNPDFPALFARYAGAFAHRYPWVQFYTPVNEIFVCAAFSGLYGWWNEQLTTDRGFVTALKHLARANLLAMHEIVLARMDAIFIQSESSEYFHPSSPSAIAPAEVMNARRFLSLDLNYGRRVDSEMYQYLLDNGLTRLEYEFFLHAHLRHHCVMGTDYYATNEHRVGEDGLTNAAGEVFGYCEITRQYHDRYKLPVMHTETNLNEGTSRGEAVGWLWRQWANVVMLRNAGVPIVGFTWYSVTDQVDWDSALREQNGNINAVGLFDLDRAIRPVGRAYKELIHEWQNILPSQSLCLTVPIVLPSETDEPYVVRRREWMRQYMARRPHFPGQRDHPSGC